MTERCTWTQDGDYDVVYEASCGLIWQFINGGPEENGVKYCPKCGKLIDVVVKLVEGEAHG